jgi:hypothetical protein
MCNPRILNIICFNTCVLQVKADSIGLSMPEHVTQALTIVFNFLILLCYIFG